MRAVRSRLPASPGARAAMLAREQLAAARDRWELERAELEARANASARENLRIMGELITARRHIAKLEAALDRKDD